MKGSTAAEVKSVLEEQGCERQHLTPNVYNEVLRYISLEYLPENFYEILESARNLPESASWFSKRFGASMAFGTAGLRDVMGVGFGAMNHITVLQTTQGVCAKYINDFGVNEVRRRGVVIGYDGRYNSRFFAHVCAAVWLSRDVPVYLFSTITATPLTPFAVVKYDAICGIQITASHNPKADNGYKLYGPNGAQIIPPADEEITKLIKTSQMPWEGTKELVSIKTRTLNFAHPRMALVTDPLRFINTSYMNHIHHSLFDPELTATVKNSNLKIVYTAMHGVGYPFIEEILLDKLGFPKGNFYPVPEQKFPDPEFSTAVFPNPEEKGALDLALKLADNVGASMVIANDPDADRFACAEKRKDGSWHVFHGDELGILFGYIMMEKGKKRGVKAEDMMFICSAVSSRMLQKMAITNGSKFFDTMTGFKWMMNKALDERRKNPELVSCLVYEEALGYAVDIACPDKDGVSAAGVWIEAACKLYEEGTTFFDLLDSLRQKYGYYVTNNSYYFCYDSSELWSLFKEFRNDGKYCQEIGDFKIARIRDVTTGYDSAATDHKCEFPLTPSANMITIWFENGAVVTLRTSGTEPKLKWYAEMAATDPKIAKDQLQAVVDAIDKQIFQPNKYNLQYAGRK